MSADTLTSITHARTARPTKSPKRHALDSVLYPGVSRRVPVVEATAISIVHSLEGEKSALARRCIVGTDEPARIIAWRSLIRENGKASVQLPEIGRLMTF